MLKHILNKHPTIEQTKEKFKFYCELCKLYAFGSFSKDTFNIHITFDKHKIYSIIKKY